VLDELRIQNLGVIADATLPLAPGLTCITGETGAGKTMVVAGLGLLFGGRASRAPIGAEKAVVEGRLLIGENTLELRERAIEAGAELEDGELLLARSVSTEGRSRAWVGGRAAPVGVLSELGELAISVHGQSDQMRLLQPAEQRAALDRFAGADHGKLLDSYRSIYIELNECTAELARLRTSSRDMAREADMLRLGLEEITAVDPQEGEDAALAEEARRLQNAETLRLAAATAHGALTGDPTTGDGGSADAVGAAARTLEHDAADDPKLGEFAERLAEAGALLSETAVDLSRYLDELDADPARLEEIYQRQAALKSLYRKYAEDLPGVLAWAENANKRLGELEVSDDRIAELEARQSELSARAGEAAAQLRASRKAAATRFSEAVSAELGGLAMPHATVTAAVEPRPPGRGGVDLVVDTTVSGASEDGADAGIDLVEDQHGRAADLGEDHFDGEHDAGALPRHARHRSGLRRDRRPARAGLRRGRCRRRRPSRRGDRPLPRQARPPLPGARGHTPAAGGGLRRPAPRGQQGHLGGGHRLRRPPRGRRRAGA
jgi:DNA repair protein RecN (Recombination protein N)